MVQLIKLEWKKNQIGKYIRNACITTGVLLLFILVMAAELEADETIALYGKSMIGVSVEMFTHMSYVVFTGVMLAAFIVNGYETKSVHLMFSYPIKRQKILLSQMLAVWIFNVTALLISKVFIYLVLILTREYTGISAESIPFGESSFWMELVISSFVMVSIGYIALGIGLWMKSTRAVIVASLVLVCLSQGNIGVHTLNDNVLFYLLLIVLSILAVWLSVYRIESKDVL